MIGSGWPTVLRVAVAGISASYLAARATVLLANVLTQRTLRPGTTSKAAASTQSPRRVSILIPARDEEATLRETLSGFLAQGADAVLVLDDESADATRSVAEGSGARVIAGRPRPEAWTGKNWACAQLAAEAGARVEADAGAGARLGPTSGMDAAVTATPETGTRVDPASWSRPGAGARDDVLVFTDADVRWGMGALDALLTTMAETRADLLTVFPRQETRTLGERLITPLNDAVVLGSVPVALHHRRAPVVANGQVMAFTRSAYERIGGHAAVRGELVEDMRLAELVRAAGGRLVVARGGDAIGVRMYDSYRASVRGFAKSLLGLHGGSRTGLLATSALVVCVYTLPWVLGLPPRASARPTSVSRVLHLVRLAGLLDRAVVNVVTGRIRPSDIAEGLLGPISPLLVLPVYVLAFRRRVAWKGRDYVA